MAYVYMPLFFSIIAYGIVYLMAYDLVNLVTNTVGMVMADEAPDFTTVKDSDFELDLVEIQKTEEGEVVKRSDVEIAEFGEQYANIVCKKIALNAPVYKGDDEAITMKGIGQNFASSQPGFGRIILLCGHNNTYFNALKNIGVGDVVEMQTNYGTYKYKVYETKVLNENDKSAYNFNEKKEKLVLYTCYPFDMLSRTQYRFFVYADLISGPKFID